MYTVQYITVCKNEHNKKGTSHRNITYAHLQILSGSQTV